LDLQNVVDREIHESPFLVPYGRGPKYAPTCAFWGGNARRFCVCRGGRVICGKKNMRAVVQRVTRCRVTVGGRTAGEIGPGLLILLGVGRNDNEAAADYLAEKIIGLRIFEDENGKMNLSVLDTHAELLVVSQFTLYGDVRRGKRPSFDAAARPEEARRLYEYLVAKVRATGLRCETGEFQAMMDVELVNSGPVTIILDSEKAF
jgi:D-tyrosyl-tRNA(Tyr) deacylase